MVRTLNSSTGLKGQLLRGGIGSLAVRVASTALNLFLAVLLARLLGAAEFGLYSFILATITILAIPAQMGLPNLVVRETAKAQATEEWALMKGLWQWSAWAAFAMSGAIAILTLLVVWLFSSSIPERVFVALYWGLLLIPLIAFGNLRGAALRGLRHVVQGQLPEYVLRPLFFALLVLSMPLLLSRVPTAADAMLLHVLGSVLSFLIGAMLLNKYRPASLVNSGVTLQPRRWLASAMPLALMEGMLVLNDNIGLLILGIIAQPTDVALFKIALQGSGLVTFGFVAINAVIGPHVARMHARGDHHDLHVLAINAARASILLAVPIASIFIFLGADIITLVFGSQFSEANTALIILSLSQLINAASGCTGALLYMTGRESLVGKAILVSSAINVALTLSLGHKLGPLGAAMAGSVALVVWNAILYLNVRKELGIRAGAWNRIPTKLANR